MRPRVYEYRSVTRWTGEHKGKLGSEEKQEIEIACPPEFGGHIGYWTPEHLFVASIEVCIMTTFLSLFEKAGGTLVSYESRAMGRASLRDWVFQFTDIDIEPTVVVAGEEDVSKAQEALDNAAGECLISKSLKFTPKVTPKINTASNLKKNGGEK